MQKLVFLLTLLFSLSISLSAQVDFEDSSINDYELPSDIGVLKQAKGKLVIFTDKRNKNNKCLRISGDSIVELTLETPASGKKLYFLAERWSSKGEFSVKVEQFVGGDWNDLQDLSKKIKVVEKGKTLTSKIFLSVAKGATKLRITSITPENAGLLIDNLSWGKPLNLSTMAMKVKTGVIIETETQPMLKRAGVDYNPLVQFTINAKGSASPYNLKDITFKLTGDLAPEQIKALAIIVNKQKFPVNAAGKVTINSVLVNGANLVKICCELKETALVNRKIGVKISSVNIEKGGETTALEITDKSSLQRVGYGICLHGDFGSKHFRIPGVATTNKGSLIAVYDARYTRGGDLPGHIDVGMSRSTDGGNNWEDMKIIMDMGSDKKWSYDGIGDPAILVDRGNGRIWVAATWSHGQNAWRTSGQGLEPKDTGQLMLVYSDDDGVSWSDPINITKQIKKPDWHYVLQGPGRGITMRDGTIVFPAQFQDETKHANGKKTARPWSALLYSKDHGKTWHWSTGVASDTTEATIAELNDGSIMINCRNNRSRRHPDGSRIIFTTRDLGETWQEHPTSWRPSSVKNDKWNDSKFPVAEGGNWRALQEPTCQGSLMTFSSTKDGYKQDILLWFNPNSRSARNMMTVKVSLDEGKTWPTKYNLLVRVPSCSGYSAICKIDNENFGVVYEGKTEIHFVKLHIKELLGDDWQGSSKSKVVYP